MINTEKDLFKMQDIEYKAFHAKLMPTVNPDTIIGVRVPLVRAYAKKIKNDANAFLKTLPHKYYEENNLHAFLISETNDYHKCIDMLNEFLPFVDNWATCDGIRPKCFKYNKKALLNEIKIWLNSRHIYTVRFAIEMLMVHFLDDDFDEKYLKMVSEIKSDEYYINMMIAWYFATALAKQWDCAVNYIENPLLPRWVHNKTIQKAIESYRVSGEQKKILKKIKKENYR
ncbi:MAG: DNA alkylation repair protein [Clostridia bacterium]|nr:DNA alkylation repair protein [Clostridia bacterium]